MDLKSKLVRSLERATIDKKELHDTVLKYKKRLDEAGKVLETNSHKTER